MTTIGHIQSIGYSIPSGRLTNQEVLQRFQADNRDRFTPQEMEYILYGHLRKFEFLGIETRSCPHPGSNETTIGMAVDACRKALQSAHCSIEAIDCLICCGVSNPFREPSFALILARQLALDGDYFDVNDTCNGFMKSMELASLYLRAGKYAKVLIVTSENPYETAAGLGIGYRVKERSTVDDTFAGLLVGSGAAALILGNSGPGAAIVGYEEKKYSTQWDASILTIPSVAFPTDSGFAPSCGFRADARLISSQIIKDMPPFILTTLAGWQKELHTIDYCILHQLGNNVTFALMDQMQIGHDKAPVNTFREFGNLACANIAVNCAIAQERQIFKKGDSILLMSMACGLTYGLMYIIW